MIEKPSPLWTLSIRRRSKRMTRPIVTAGPFQGMPLTVLQACIVERVPYIDVADDRDLERVTKPLRDFTSHP